MLIRTTILALFCLASALAADVAGTWNVTATTSSGREYKLQLVLKDEGGKLVGTISNEQGSIALEELKVAGDELSYRIPASGGIVTKLTVAGAAMNGTFTTADGATGKVVASRAAAAKPASIAGHWNCEATTSSGRPYKLQLDLAEEGGKLSGTITRADGSAPIDDAKLEGNNLSFKVAADGTVYTIKLTVEGQTLKGSYATPTGEGGNMTGGR
jgi:hypothetical protein